MLQPVKLPTLHLLQAHSLSYVARNFRHTRSHSQSAKPKPFLARYCIAFKTHLHHQSNMSTYHLAAMLLSRGSPFTIQPRPTPIPGPSELLIAVHSIALNNIDNKQRQLGIGIASYPAIVGSDISGTVVAAGSSLSSDAPKHGTRVVAFAPAFFEQGKPDYGAFQEMVLVPASNVAVLPERWSFNEGCALPMAVATAWSGLYSIGVARETSYSPEDKVGMLVWGAASGVGSAVVEVAKTMGFVVYAVASEKHHAFLKTLGAAKCFDYNDEDVVENIVKDVRADGVSMTTGYDSVAQWKYSVEVMRQSKGDGVSKLASAVRLSEETPKVDGVEVKFVAAPARHEAMTEHFHFVFAEWLNAKLADGSFVLNTKVKVVGKGLEAISAGLDELQKGVSGVKLVVQL